MSRRKVQAEAVAVNPHWIYHLIRRGVIDVERDGPTGMYLFPDSEQTTNDFRRLKGGEVARLSCRTGHRDDDGVVKIDGNADESAVRA